MAANYTEKQMRLINDVRQALDCGGDCSAYCYGCTPADMRRTKWADKLLSEGRITADILQAANT